MRESGNNDLFRKWNKYSLPAKLIITICLDADVCTDQQQRRRQ